MCRPHIAITQVAELGPFGGSGSLTDRHGKITDVRGGWDSSDIWQQLGLIPDTETILRGSGGLVA